MLETSSSNFYNILFTRLRLKVIKVAEEVEMRLYAKECFAEVDKNGYVRNEIGVKVVKLDAIMEEKTMEEIGSKEAQTTFNEMLEQNNFLHMFIL
jgi:hypothetical protein